MPKEAAVKPYKPHIIYSSLLNLADPSSNLFSIFSYRIAHSLSCASTLSKASLAVVTIFSF